MGIVWFHVPLDTFLGHFGDGGVTVASARIVAAVSERNPTVRAVLSSVAQSALNSATPQCVRC